MIVLDASVLIAHLDEHDLRHARAVERLLHLADEPLACSPVTLAEVLVSPARHERLDAAHDALTDLGIRQVALAADAPTRLARLRAETGLKLPDCCVLLAAQDDRADTVLTFDDRLARAALRLGFGADERGAAG